MTSCVGFTYRYCRGWQFKLIQLQFASVVLVKGLDLCLVLAGDELGKAAPLTSHPLREPLNGGLGKRVV